MEFCPQFAGTSHIPGIRLDTGMGGMLDMAGLTLDEETVDIRTVRLRQHLKIHREPHQREKIHRLGRRDDMRITQDPASTTDLVEKFGTVILKTLETRIHLMVDNRLQHVTEALDDLGLALA